MALWRDSSEVLGLRSSGASLFATEGFTAGLISVKPRAVVAGDHVSRIVSCISDSTVAPEMME